MLKYKTLILLVLALLAPMVFAQQNVVEDFIAEMNQEITGGNVSSGSHISEEVPEELQGIEVLWGYTCKADGSPATYVWVYAKGKNKSYNYGWTHTSWSDVGVPRRYDVYKHGPGMPQPIYPEDQYYIKGLSWIPMNTEDFPPRNQNPPSPPGWAQGDIRSPTYLSEYWYDDTSLHGPDVFFTGNPRMW